MPQNTPEVQDEEVIEINDDDDSHQDAVQRRLRDRSTITRPARYEINYAECEVPGSFKETISGPDANNWKGAIQEELEAHQKNGTWSIIQAEEGQRLIDSRWVFRLIQNSSGEIRRYKARLCARGFMQEHGIDYSETFSPVVRYSSVRVFLSIVASKDLELVQFDIKTAFLYGKIDKKIFMKIPEGVTVKNTGKLMVCKLNKALYGLKQAPRCWNLEIKSFFNRFKFETAEADSCIFHGQIRGDDVYLALFVDDGLIAAKNHSSLYKILDILKESFEITVGNTDTFVGLQIKRDRKEKKLLVHQEAYTKRLIDKFGMKDAKSISIPADTHTVLQPIEDEFVPRENVPYREAVGSLLFLATATRPDIAFAVNQVSRYLEKHDDSHWQAIKRIIRHLQGTANFGICFSANSSAFQLLGYSDADYASDKGTRRSTSGYVFLLASEPITWSSERQKMVTLSTTEAEYVAATSATKEVIWLRRLLKDFGCGCVGASDLYVDNQSAIKLAKNPEYHKRTKHIDIRFHFIREKVASQEINLEYVPSELQLADILTKALPKERFCQLRDNLVTSLGSLKLSSEGSVEE